MSTHGCCWVFAYGSNMNVEDLLGWFRDRGYLEAEIQEVQPAALIGYRLAWNYYSKGRCGGAANIEPAAGQELPGLALKINDAALRAIDRKEGHPTFYTRGDHPLRVRLAAGGEVEAWVYIARPERCGITPVWPRQGYLQLLIAAAEGHHLPDWYISQLKATPTAD